MNVEQSYFAVSSFFNLWVRLMEYRTRRMEVLDSVHLGSKRLIISPPTDAGIPLLARANVHGQTDLLCFSDRIERIAMDYRRKRKIEALATLVEPFFGIPAPDERFSVVYANCLFDFCAAEEFDPMFLEIWRVLEPHGVLFAVYMSPSSHWHGRLWTSAFDRLTFLSNGCHPVTIAPELTRNGFRILKDLPAARLGFPVRYSVSEKSSQVA